MKSLWLRYILWNYYYIVILHSSLHSLDDTFFFFNQFKALWICVCALLPLTNLMMAFIKMKQPHSLDANTLRSPNHCSADFVLLLLFLCGISIFPVHNKRETENHYITDHAWTAVSTHSKLDVVAWFFLILFLNWANFKIWAFVLRDRNHPIFVCVCILHLIVLLLLLLLSSFFIFVAYFVCHTIFRCSLQYVIWPKYAIYPIPFVFFRSQFWVCVCVEKRAISILATHCNNTQQCTHFNLFRSKLVHALSREFCLDYQLTDIFLFFFCNQRNLFNRIQSDQIKCVDWLSAANM